MAIFPGKEKGRKRERLNNSSGQIFTKIFLRNFFKFNSKSRLKKLIFSIICAIICLVDEKRLFFVRPIVFFFGDNLFFL